MTKEQLTAIGLTEEQAVKALDLFEREFKSAYVPATQVEELKTELKQAKDTHATELQQAKDTHAGELKRVRIDSAIELALTGARAKNIKAARAMLDGFIETAELDENGVVKGLEEAVEKLVTSDDTNFLFDSQKLKITGAVPVEGADRDIKTMGAFGDAVDFARTVAKSQANTTKDAQNYYFQ